MARGLEPGSFLDELDPEVRPLLRARGTEVTYGRHEAILREGATDDHVVVILAGRACIFRTHQSGRESALAVRGPGELIGEMRVINGATEPRSASVVALDRVRALTLPGPVFMDLLTEQRAVVLATLRHLANRLRTADVARAELASGSTAQRLARLLAQHALASAGPGSGPIEVAQRLTQSQMADLVGASRESIVRALGELRANGIIATGRRSVRVLDLDRLAQLGTTG